MIIEIDDTHTLWPELLELVKSVEQRLEWLTSKEDYHLSNHVLVAVENNVLIGFLRFTVREFGWPLGDGISPITFNGKKLIEAKVETFGVRKNYQNKGVGRVLQKETMKRAKEIGCYQLRSKSACHAKANYHLKISLGFGVQPHRKEQAVYFVKAL
jgi:GNAT superfamily N-acetyltransferase